MGGVEQKWAGLPGLSTEDCRALCQVPRVLFDGH